MIVRIRSERGTFRIESDPNDDITSLKSKIARQLKLSDSIRILISNDPKPSTATPISDLVGKTLDQLEVRHGDMLFVTLVDPGVGSSSSAASSSLASSSSSQQQQKQEKEKEREPRQELQSTTILLPSASTSTSFPSVKQHSVDDFLEKQEGLIARGRDPKFCKHSSNGMCDYCMPLEPYDLKYLAEKGIKHMSFHSYLCKIRKEFNKNSRNARFIPPLEEPDFRVKENCSGGHAPWPEGICTSCQPGAITLQPQSFRMVDHVEFSSPSHIEDFINYWRSTGLQRFGYMYGRYEPYPDVPLGIKAVVEAIYEPPQEGEVDGISLTLPWNEEKTIDDAADACGLTKVGMIYTDLTDDETGQGKVICKRHINSYFLSSQECCYAAAMQSRYFNPTRYSPTGKFGSKFVTCIVSGNKDGGVDVSAYQVSNTCVAMVTADFVEASVDPGIVRVKESTNQRYVPEVFYKYKNEYGLEVQESAKPCFPVEYFLVNVTHGFPFKPNPLFTSSDAFPIENRDKLGKQDLKTLRRHLAIDRGGSKLITAVSNFHVLAYIKQLNQLDDDEFSQLVKLAISHIEADAFALVEMPGWQKLLALIESGQEARKWSCQRCTFDNPLSASVCQICEYLKE